MKVSLNWVKEFADVQLPVEELVEKIGAQLGAVEEVIDLSKKYRGIVIAKVVSCEQHPNADKLKVCTIDDGGKAQDVKRDGNGRVQVVCGAPNVREGLLVAWLPPGSIVPSTIDKDPLKIETRDIRGVTSNGMLASVYELAVGDDHSGILEINPHDGKPGDDFAEVYKLDDYVIDIENKMFTHRPDCFGILGVAREIAGISGKQFTSPDWYTREVKWNNPDSPMPLAIKNELPELVPRFMAIAIKVTHNGPSPLWLQTYLSRVGLRPINMLVDVTNYVMLLTAQPMHAYDYDKVAKLSQGDIPTLVIRQPKPGESLTLLTGKTIEPRPETVMIATDQSLIGMGGVMGGSDTEVDEHTTTAILECANFDMYATRRAAMAHGLFTDAVTRFNKGQSPWQCDRVLGYALSMLERFEAATWASDVIDSKSSLKANKPIQVSPGFINARLGTELSTDKVASLLRNVEFEVEGEDAELKVTAPFWRTDIEITEDVVEEAGRLYGYDKLPLELPKRDLTPAKKDELLELKNRVREVLKYAGANEVLTYSFVHGNLLEKAGQNPDDSYQLSNALSPELQYYRQTLTPSLLDKVHANIKTGYDELALFELNKSHNKVRGLDDEKVPGELNMIALTYASKQPRNGAAYYQARKYLDYLTGKLGLTLTYQSLDKNPGFPVTAPFDIARSALVTTKENGVFIGIVGEYRIELVKKFKLPMTAAGFEIDTDHLLEATQKLKNSPYMPLPRFPEVEQDISLKVPVDLSYGALYDLVWRKTEELKPVQTLARLTPIDIYQREDDQKHKQVTLRLTIASYERTLTAEEVNSLLDKVALAAKETFKAQRI